MFGSRNKASALGLAVCYWPCAAVITADAVLGSSTITVANASMLEVGDRICIEGDTRTYNKETEATITAKNGNNLTISTGLVRQAKVGFIVVKTNRDCVVTTTTLDDGNRCHIYLYHGSSSYWGRKAVFRYMELSHCGNSSNSAYSGLCIRSDFNRWDNEREARGNVIRDSWSIDRGSFWLYTAAYFIARNNTCVKTQNGINPYDQNGSSVFNNITIGSMSSGFRIEAQYYYNQFQYNIALNSDYAILYYSDSNAYFPEMQNIFKHMNRGLHSSAATVSAQNGSWIKNSFQDIYYKHCYTEGTRNIFQEIEIINSSDATMSNWGSAYSNSDERGLTGGMLVIVNKDFIRGNFEMHHVGGIILKDEVIHMGNGWSYQLNTNNSTADLRISQMVYVKYGVPVKVVAYMRKNAAYNGVFKPRIIAQGKFLGFVYQEMENVNDIWVKTELNFVPPRSEMIEIGVGGRGTSGLCWIDPRVLVSTFDLDLISGPYSANLMFGLEQIHEENANIILGNTKLGG